jgi:hypothetical protein
MPFGWDIYFPSIVFAENNCAKLNIPAQMTGRSGARTAGHLGNAHSHLVRIFNFVQLFSAKTIEGK